jgi:WD40 repeat protein
VAISRDGGTVVSGSSDATVRVWDAASGELRKTLEGHSDDVYAVAISRDGGTIVSQDDSGKSLAWSASTGERVDGPEERSMEVLGRPGLANGRTTVSIGEDAAGFTADASVHHSDATAVSTDGAIVAVGDQSGRVHVLEVVRASS